MLKAADVAREYKERTGKSISAERVNRLARLGRLPVAARDGRQGAFLFSDRAVTALVVRERLRTEGV